VWSAPSVGLVGLLEAVLQNAFEGAPVSGACATAVTKNSHLRRVSAFGYAQLVQCLLAWSIAQQRICSWRLLLFGGHGWEELSTIFYRLTSKRFESPLRRVLIPQS